MTLNGIKLILSSVALISGVVTLLFLGIECQAQGKYDSRVDSILKLYETDSIKVILTLESVYGQAQNDFEGAEKALLRLKEFFLKKDFFLFQTMASIKLANLYYDNGKYVNSIIYCDQALRVLDKQSESKPTLTQKTWANLWAGLSYSLINDWENAQRFLQEAVNTAEKIGDPCLSMNVKMNLSYIFYDMKNWRMMFQLLKRSIATMDKCNDQEVKLMSLSSLVISASRLKEISEAEKYLLLAKEQVIDANPSKMNAFYFTAKGELEIAKMNLTESLNAYSEAVRIARLWNEPYYLSFTYEGLGRAYLLQGSLSKAEDFLLKSLSISKENGFMAQQRMTLLTLADFYLKRGNIDQAHYYSRELIKLSDTLDDRLNINRRLILDAKFEADKKQNEIIQLQKDNEIKNLTIQQNMLWLYFSFTGTLAIVIVGLLIYFNMQHKQNFTKQKSDLQLQQIRELEKDKQLMLADAILKGQEQERGRLAKDLHDGLGGLLSGVKIALSNMKGRLTLPADQALSFDRSLDMLDSSIQELRRVSHNMMPESLVKFGLVAALRDFCESINTMKAAALHFQLVGERRVLDVSHETIVYRIVQELVNNALKHSGAKNIIVQLMYESNTLSVTVEDDGKGFDVESVKNSTNSGWANVQSRISYLKGKLDVTSRQGEGTSVHIFLAV